MMHLSTRALLPIAAMISLLLVSACSWKGSEMWKRSVCEDIVDADERARCLEEAAQGENEYRHERDEALKY